MITGKKEPKTQRLQYFTCYQSIPRKKLTGAPSATRYSTQPPHTHKTCTRKNVPQKLRRPFSPPLLDFRTRGLLVKNVAKNVPYPRGLVPESKADREFFPRFLSDQSEPRPDHTFLCVKHDIGDNTKPSIRQTIAKYCRYTVLLEFFQSVYPIENGDTLNTFWGRKWQKMTIFNFSQKRAQSERH